MARSTVRKFMFGTPNHSKFYFEWLWCSQSQQVPCILYVIVLGAHSHSKCAVCNYPMNMSNLHGTFLLQTVCRDVLTGSLPSLVDWGSLFSDAPASIAPKLNAALQECLKQTSVDHEIPMYKPPLSVLTKLIRLLLQSLAEENALWGADSSLVFHAIWSWQQVTENEDN